MKKTELIVKISEGDIEMAEGLHNVKKEILERIYYQIHPEEKEVKIEDDFDIIKAKKEFNKENDMYITGEMMKNMKYDALQKRRAYVLRVHGIDIANMDYWPKDLEPKDPYIKKETVKKPTFKEFDISSIDVDEEDE